MKKTIIFLASILFIATLFTSCKDDECPIDEPTKTELLLKAEWIGDEIVVYENDIETHRSSISNLSMVFLPNFEVLFYEEEEMDELSEWQFMNNEQSIKLFGGEICNIDTLSETDFIISLTKNENDDVVKYVYSFKH